MRTSGLNPTGRFSNRVENYLRYRPRYPREVITVLREQHGLDEGHAIADIGSGTGFLAELFLDNGNQVTGIEPNKEMREAGATYLGTYPGFSSRNGTAECTGLEEESVDFVVAGQAFHWFNPVAARTEFLRILRSPAHVALIWNHRKTHATPFLIAYEDLLRRYAFDYDKVAHRVVSSDESLIATFFAPHGFQLDVIYDHEQVFDLDGLTGRLLSSSYAPVRGEPHHETMLGELRRIFNEHQEGGTVRFLYDTMIYHGTLGHAR